MSDMISVSCPGCEAVFELPAELGGELGECTECGAIFEIPVVEGIKSGNVETTDTGAIKVQKTSADEGTNTVKLSRSSIGMVPDIKDNFQFDVVSKAPSATATSVTADAGGMEAAAPSPKKKSFKKTRTSTRTAQTRTKKPPPKPQKKWWQFWMFWK